MKYSIMALPAIAAAVSAQDLNSIFNVLQTALPPSLVAEALTNSAAVSSEIASQFAAGETPSWYSALPTDIQSYFAPTDAAGASSVSSAFSTAVTAAVGNGNLTSNPVTSAPTVIGTGTLLPGGVNGTTAIGGNGTAINGSGNSTSLSTSASLSASTTSNGGSEETGTGSSNSGADASSTADSSDSGAAMVTGFFGMSLAGAVGVIGVLAL